MWHAQEKYQLDTQLKSRNLNKKYNLKCLGVAGKILLKLILMTYYLVVQTGFSWFRIGPVVMLL
jgi:hypothetical protein